MLNYEVKEEVLQKLKEKTLEYMDLVEMLQKEVELLFFERNRSFEILYQSTEYINSFKNTPIGFQEKNERVKYERKKFEDKLKTIENEDIKKQNYNNTIVATGIITGMMPVGIGLAESLITTFGNSIPDIFLFTPEVLEDGRVVINESSSLLKYLKDWGKNIKNMPLKEMKIISFAVGAATMIGGSLYVNYSNKKIAADSLEQLKIVEIETTKVECILEQVKVVIKKTKALERRLEHSLWTLNRDIKIIDYKQLCDEEKKRLAIYLRNAAALAELNNKLITTEVGDV